MTEKLAHGMATAILKEALGDRAPEIDLSLFPKEGHYIPGETKGEVLVEDLTTLPTAYALWLASFGLLRYIATQAQHELSHRDYQFVRELANHLKFCAYEILWLHTGAAKKVGLLGVMKLEDKFMVLGLEQNPLPKFGPDFQEQLQKALQREFPDIQVIMGGPMPPPQGET